MESKAGPRCLPQLELPSFLEVPASEGFAVLGEGGAGRRGRTSWWACSSLGRGGGSTLMVPSAWPKSGTRAQLFCSLCCPFSPPLHLPPRCRIHL